MPFQVSLRPHLQGLKPYIPGKPIEELERELGIRNAIKVASNENPLGSSPKVKKAIEKVLDKIHRYPDGGAYSLSKALASYLRVKTDEILLGHGSNELLVLLGQMVLKPGDEVLYAEPGFIIYPLVAQLFEAVGKAIPLKKDAHDMEAFAKALTPRTRLVYIANPNNPTGTVIPLEEVEIFIKRCPANVLIVLDEAYYEYVSDKRYFESMVIRKRYPNLVILRTFSKAFGLAGLRVGYGVGHPELVEVYQKTREPFNVNSLAMVAAEAALADRAHVAKVVKLNKKMRTKLYDGLVKLGFHPAQTQANFVYFKVDHAPDLYQKLLRKGVIVRPMGPAALRITTGTNDETVRFLKAFKEVIHEK